MSLRGLKPIFSAQNTSKFGFFDVLWAKKWVLNPRRVILDEFGKNVFLVDFDHFLPFHWPISRYKTLY